MIFEINTSCISCKFCLIKQIKKLAAHAQTTGVDFTPKNLAYTMRSCYNFPWLYSWVKGKYSVKVVKKVKMIAKNVVCCANRNSFDIG